MIIELYNKSLFTMLFIIITGIFKFKFSTTCLYKIMLFLPNLKHGTLVCIIFYNNHNARQLHSTIITCDTFTVNFVFKNDNRWRVFLFTYHPE